MIVVCILGAPAQAEASLCDVAGSDWSVPNPIVGWQTNALTPVVELSFLCYWSV